MRYRCSTLNSILHHCLLSTGFATKLNRPNLVFRVLNFVTSRILEHERLWTKKKSPNFFNLCKFCWAATKYVNIATLSKDLRFSPICVLVLWICSSYNSAICWRLCSLPTKMPCPEVAFTINDYLFLQIIQIVEDSYFKSCYRIMHHLTIDYIIIQHKPTKYTLCLWDRASLW